MSTSGYTNELQIPDMAREIAALRKRVEELERRALRFAESPPDFGCCTSYCCVESPLIDIEIGNIEDFCIVDPDPIGGVGMRLDVSGWVKLEAVDAGLIWARVWVDVDGVEYVGDPEELHTMAASDRFTIHFGNTIDSSTPDPTVTIRVQNLNTPTIKVRQIYRSLWVAGLDGSPACGEPAGQ